MRLRAAQSLVKPQRKNTLELTENSDGKSEENNKLMNKKEQAAMEESTQNLNMPDTEMKWPFQKE